MPTGVRGANGLRRLVSRKTIAESKFSGADFLPEIRRRGADRPRAREPLLSNWHNSCQFDRTVGSDPDLAGRRAGGVVFGPTYRNSSISTSCYRTVSPAAADSRPRAGRDGG